MTKSFSAQVDDWIKKVKGLEEAIFLKSVEKTIEIAQTPVAKGGRMRIDTSYLRNSGTTTLNAPVATVTFNLNKDAGLNRDDSIAVIAGADITDTIYFTWTANYARIREQKDGFRLGAMQEWQTTVNQVVQSAKSRFGR